jgi:SAM-dependent methyltransferase
VPDKWFRGISSERDVPEIDPCVPHPARIYDYWLGGKDNFAADREAGQRAIEAFPDTVNSVRANRAFLARAVRYLTADAAVSQFLDIGTGLPSANNIHDVAQAITPDCRVVYVDNDPIVGLHARALLTSVTGPTAYVDADLREPGKILDAAAKTLDFSEPVAIMLIGVLHFIPDLDGPHRIVATLLDAVVPGSHLAISHVAKDIHPEQMVEFMRCLNDCHPATPGTLRSRGEVCGFFGGLELLEPGVVQPSKWRPSTELEATAPTALWCGVASKRAGPHQR